MWRTYGHSVAVMALLILAVAATSSAQVTAGETSMNLNGTVSAGYSGSFANDEPSSHGIGFGGTGDLSGFYHSSQFLSFNIAPFYDQSRNNSTYQSITDSSGVTASTSIFGGSNYPGYVNYSDVYNSEGNYFLPGTANYRTNGNSQTFGVGWSGHPTNRLSFSGGYEGAKANSSVYGTTNEIESDFHSVFGTLNYTLAGFRLGGGVHYSNGNYTFPQFLVGQTSQASHVDTTTYDFNLSRGLARYDTTTWLNYSRDTTSYNALGTKDSETDDVVTGGVSLKPTNKLSASFGADYDDNLAGAVYQVENSAGALVPVSLPGEKSHSWGVYGEAQYDLANEFYLTGDVTEREQLFLGTSVSSTAWSGGADYGHRLLGGRFTGGAFVTRSNLGDSYGSIWGLSSNAIYSRYIAAWNFSGSFGYSRNAETFLIGYTTSGYNYSTSVSRQFGRLSWNGTAAGSKSLFSQSVGTTSFTQSYSTGLSYRWLGVSGGYSRSSGIGLYTNQGIAPPPSGLPPTLLPSPVPYSGTTYSVGLGGTPVRGLIFSGSFARTRSSTESELLASNNRSDEANAYLQYQFRKVFFTAGYSRLVQGFSASTLAPAMVSTYYFGVSRWFKVF
jgi:hypothetical protein